MRIVIVEDHITLAEGIAHVMRDTGHSVDILNNGRDALDFLKHEQADIIILDVNLPGLSGLELVRRLRRAKVTTPVIMLTALGETSDRINGLDAGADDYMVKPFEMEELQARVRALLRRGRVETHGAKSLGPLSYDRATRELKINGEVVVLPKKELATFECFFERPNKIVSKAVLADHIYGVGSAVEEKVVEVYVSRLRKHLAASGVKIQVARGLGYLMSVPEQ